MRILVSCYTRIMSSLPAADTVTHTRTHVRKILEPTALGLSQTETIGRYCVVWHQPDQQLVLSLRCSYVVPCVRVR